MAKMKQLTNPSIVLGYPINQTPKLVTKKNIIEAMKTFFII